MTLLRLEDIHKKYRMEAADIHALRGVDLTINQGEYVAITGPSGSGKSTLMHIIGLLDHPTEGAIRLKGEDVSSLSGNERARLRNKEIGFIFQGFNLSPRASALENVEMPLIYAGVPSRERRDRAREILELVGLGKRLENTPAQLSGGQQQRVAVARALINNPSIVLPDEPTGNLDTGTGSEIMDLFDTLHRQGNTIILVTHELDLADRAQRRIQLVDGNVVEDTEL